MKGVIFLSLILSFSLLVSVRGQAASKEESLKQVKEVTKEILDEANRIQREKNGPCINFFADKTAEFIVKVCFNNCACLSRLPPVNLSSITLPENASQTVKGVSNVLCVDACVGLLELFDMCMDMCTEMCL